MPGAFDASVEFDHDPLATEEEIQRCGVDVLRWLEDLASTSDPRPIDTQLVQEIHRRWFDTTFPADAGRVRTATVINRKGTAQPVATLINGLVSACENWKWRREHATPAEDAEYLGFSIGEANTLAISIYDVHPFIDGNTRATWHLRNYALMLDGLRPLVDLQDQETYEAAWWSATPHDHEELDAIVIEELGVQDR